MKRYLVKVEEDVADEGSVGLIKVLNEKELKKAKSINTGFGNIEGDSYSFDDVADVEEITEDEYKTLKKLGLIDLEFGYCDISYEEIDGDGEEYEE